MFFPVLILDLIQLSFSGWGSSSASSLCGCLALVGENKGNKLKKHSKFILEIGANARFVFIGRILSALKALNFVVTAAIYGICFNVR